MSKESYRYPLRGLGVMAIFICVGPFVQTIAALSLQHQFTVGSEIVVEYTNFFQQKILPSLIAGYSEFLPAPLLTGLWLGALAAKGQELKLTTIIGRAVVASLAVEVFIDLTLLIQGVPLTSEFLYANIRGCIIQAIAFGWVCFIIATIFRYHEKPRANPLVP